MKIRSRRQFLRGGASIAAGFMGLQRFLATAAPQPYQSQINGFGKLVYDPKRILDLPEGFSYRVLSITGDRMSDGLRTPGKPDGMGAFAGPDGRVIVVRNHEMEDQWTFGSPFGITNELLDRVAPGKLYDSGKGIRPQLGGTTTIVYNPANGQVEKQFLSLAGTTRNCAGGPTPWGSWITCEETVFRPKSAAELEAAKKREADRAKKEAEKTPEQRAKEQKETDDYLAKLSPKRRAQILQAKEEASLTKPEDEIYYEQWHGYNFEVPASTEMKLVDPVPLKAMGRFYHEAVAVDPKSGIVYQTEDRDNGLITRFIPDEPGNLRAGGRLQAMVIKGKRSCDTRNWPDTGEPSFPKERPMEVEWMDLEDIDNPKDDLRVRAYDQGAAMFARGEGMWYGNGKIFIACTSGGVAQSGQIFVYEPSPDEGKPGEHAWPGRLTLYLEPNNTQLLQYGDNLTVSPWGDVVLCEDGAEDQYLRGITPEGKMYTLGRSSYDGKSEICGCCFAPNHQTLFLNLQNPGITLAIYGPWERLSSEASS